MVQGAKRRGIPLIGELDLVAPHIRGKLVAVTGSNGKSTVTSLIGHMLRRAGRNVGVGGNLGTAASTFTDRDFDAVVLELSSFQLVRASVLSTAVSVVMTRENIYPFAESIIMTVPSTNRKINGVTEDEHF